MQNRPLNEELLRALAYYGAAGGTGGGGGGGVSAYNDLLGKPIITSQKYTSGITINGTKSLQDYGIPENLQEIFDLDKIQDVTFAEESKLKLQNTNLRTTAELSSNGIAVLSKWSSGATPTFNSITIDGEGTMLFSGNALDNLVHGMEDLVTSDKLVDVANWSATTTIIGNVDYYTNVLTFTKVHRDHPEVTICPVGSTSLPTIQEREAFTLVSSTGYFYADRNTNKITCYSQVKPTSSFKITVRGAK